MSMASQTFHTDDIKLAAYLSLLGEDPLCVVGDGRVKYHFTIAVSQEVILRFYAGDSISLAPLTILTAYQKLISRSKLAVLHIPAEVFQS